MLNLKEKQETKPIFIIGSPRSGTSIITHAIKLGGNVTGYAEGHFLPLITQVMKTIEDYYEKNQQSSLNKRRAFSQIDRGELESKIIEAFSSIYDSLIQEQIWIDKTPGSSMIEASPYILKAWPKSRFIFAKRRGIECVISRLKKFPNVSFENHCKLWQQSMENWLAVKESLAGHYLEIEQRDLSLNPQDISQQIGNFLELDNYQITKIKNIFTTKRLEFTGGKEAFTAIDLLETGWTKEQIEIYKKHCDFVSSKFGYSHSKSYYLM